MQLGADHVRVRVPATSANLGPGFDALGLALALYDDVEVRAVASADVVVRVEGEGAGEVPDDESHLVVQALQAALELAGAPRTGLEMTCVNRIPHGRGLGSSAAAVVAGIAAARALVADPSVLADDVALALATRFEGHPDNAAPALLGGATIAWCRTGPASRPGTGPTAADDGGPGRPRAVRLAVDPRLVATALVPRDRVATRHARGVLPERVPHADAAFNAGRSALLVEALTRRPDLLFEATEDKLHQDYRAEVMASSHQLVGTLRGQGLAAVISGAGPTVLVLGTEADAARLDAVAADLGGLAGWESIRPGIDARGATAHNMGGLQVRW